MKELIEDISNGCKFFEHNEENENQIELPTFTTHAPSRKIEFKGHVVLPKKIDGLPIKAIGVAAFEGCVDLTSVVIPNGVVKIGAFAFKGCTGLTSVKIPKGVTAIEWEAFLGCTNLTSVTIPKSVTHIGGQAFGGCKSLTSVKIPEGVIFICRQLFKNCSSLASVTIPSSVILIKGDAFTGCTALKEIIFKGPPPLVCPIRKGESNDFETLPATMGYYLPKNASHWEVFLGGPTGQWKNLQMQPIPEEMLKTLK